MSDFAVIHENLRSAMRFFRLRHRHRRDRSPARRHRYVFGPGVRSLQHRDAGRRQISPADLTLEQRLVEIRQYFKPKTSSLVAVAMR